MSSGNTRDPTGFRRRFLLAGFGVSLLEVAAVALPLLVFFHLDESQWRVLQGALPIALACGWLVWWLAFRFWRAPIDRALRRRRANLPIEQPDVEAAYHATLTLTARAMWLRGGIAAVIGTLMATLLSRYDPRGFPPVNIVTVAMVTLMHMLAVQVFRALAYNRLLDRARDALVFDNVPLRRFRDQYFNRLLQGAMMTGVFGVTAIGAFAYLFLPIHLEQALRLETWFPLTIIPLVAIWYIMARAWRRPIDRYLEVVTSSVARDAAKGDDPRALAAYRTAQVLPYKLAIAKFAFWVVGEALLVAEGTLFFRIDFENGVVLFGAALVVTVGAALYEALWHRATLRPLLAHVALRHRPRPETVRTPLSLRNKMLAAFGGLTLFSCGLSLFLSFVQYKTLATAFIQREARLRLDRIVSDLDTRAARAGRPLVAADVAPALRAMSHDEAVVYYVPPESGAHAIALGGGKAGPPPLNWAGERLVQRLQQGQIELSEERLSGSFARLYDDHHVDIGSLAVALPGYRGRGPNLDPYLALLLFFFVVLAAASMGIVVLVVTDLTGPIRLLEQRAGAMAQGDLSRPVINVSGEADEVGRLTFAFEEMRRALNDKLRSSTEINLSLEQEVRRRTGELERSNQELKDALAALQRTQAELVRSEKMASMGRLVAGIAHEINNPVNAVVNTASPLEATLEDLMSRLGTLKPAEADEIAAEVREMTRVIQRGARRTKEIVQALHNYSRGDDDRLVDVDLHRGIDESLDLLRHHLKHGIVVERRYGDVGRVRGYAGQLHQVFMNLLTNAAQALSEQVDQGGKVGTIQIATARNHGKVVITVADDGPGIPLDVLPRIFDPFFTTKEVGKGSGLGLSIVHGIVERHGGTISVDSEVSRGTTFTVTLPADAPARVIS